MDASVERILQYKKESFVAAPLDDDIASDDHKKIVETSFKKSFKEIPE